MTSRDLAARYTCVLEAFATGDAMGMPTEFMTRRQIAEVYPTVTGLLDPKRSLIHANLPFACVTDDTEQNLYLIKAYQRDRTITVENTADALLRWVVECDAIEKKYIGPSSLKALKNIESGMDPYSAGTSGTTCGGMMRTPSLVVCSDICDGKAVLENIQKGCIPTHNTSQAIQAAVGYGMALREALICRELSVDAILKAASAGIDDALSHLPNIACAPSCKARLARLAQTIPLMATEDGVLDELYDLYGTGLESIDIFTAVFGIFLFVKGDVFRGICMAARIGGDTDTIAALVGALCAAYAGAHNIPKGIVAQIEQTNHFDLKAIAQGVADTFGRNG